MALTKRRCRVSAIDCDVAALVGARMRLPISLKVRVDLRLPVYELVVFDAGVSLIQAKSYWRRFSKSCYKQDSVRALDKNTCALFRHIERSIMVGGKLLIMVYSLQSVALVSELARVARTLYLINKAFIRASYLERSLRRCSSSARLLMYIKTKQL